MNNTFISLKCLSDEDWKTQCAKKYGNIPKGAKVQFRKLINNCYGIYALVDYNGYSYYVHPDDILPEA